MHKGPRFLLCAVLCLVSATSRAEPPTSFDGAKEAAVRLWWDIGPVTFYCGCPYREATPQDIEIWGRCKRCGAKRPQVTAEVPAHRRMTYGGHTDQVRAGILASSSNARSSGGDA